MLHQERGIGRGASIAALAVVLSLLGCGNHITGVRNPTNPVPSFKLGHLQELESVPYEALKGNRIAFERMAGGEGVYVVDGAAGQAQAFGFSGLSYPRVSPDGLRMAFQSFTSPEFAWDVWVVDLDGQRLTQLGAADGNFEGPPSWTPDGSGVAFADEEEPQGVWALLRLGRPGDGIAPVVYSFPHRTTQPYWGHSAQVSVAPNGDIAVSESWGLAVVNSSRTEVADVYVATDAIVMAPAYAPDGKALAFVEVAGADGLSGPIMVKRLDLSTGTVSLVGTLPPAPDAPNQVGLSEFPYSICWTVDGSTLIFTAPVDTTYHVFTVPAGGGDVAQFTTAVDVNDVSVTCLAQ